MAGASAIATTAAAQDDLANSESHDVIVVTGIRSSLQTANERKRSADSLIDGIAAEDLGKFPDQNVAESLQRVTGVTINRVAGEGAEITVRGFGPEFNLVRLNDRTLATVTEERSFDFQILPSELIVGADVVKSPTSNMWGGSIGANVNLRTARPLDGSGLTLVGSAQARYQDLGGNWGPRLSGVYSQTFADDTFGLLVGATYEDRVIRTEESRNGEGEGLGNGWFLFDGPVGGPGTEVRQFRTPARTGQSFTEDDRRRISVLGTMQWRPSDRLEMTLDGLFVDFRRNANLQGIIAPLQFPTFDPANLVINENGTAVSFTKFFAPLDIRFETSDAESKTYALGWRGTYQASEAVSFNADVSWSLADATNTSVLISPGILDNNPVNNPLPGGTANPSFRVNTLNWENGDIPTWGVSFDLTDPTNARAHVTRHLADELRDEVLEVVLDGKIEIERGFIRSVQAGGFYSDRSKSDLPFNNGVAPNGQDGPLGGNIPGWVLPGSPFAALGLINTSGRRIQPPAELFSPVTIDDLLNQSDAEFPKDFLLIDVDGYCDWLRENTGNLNICTLQRRSEFRTGVDEAIYGAFVRLDLAGELRTMPFSANLGLRFEKTETTSSGPFAELISLVAQNPDGSSSELFVNTSPTEIIDAEKQYSNVLPSFNFAMELASNTIFRFAAAKVVSRPTLASIVPGQTFPSRNFENFPRIANNPDLDPYEAFQLDGSLEYYAENGNAFSISLFYKDIATFISQQTVLIDSGFDHPAFGDIIIRDQRPRNRPGGTVQGFELAALVNFDFLPGFLENFGVQANYTFVSSEDDAANAELADLPLAKVPDTGLEGFTPHSYNIVGFYEDERFRARIAWNWRDTFLEFRSGAEGIATHINAYGQLDAGFGFKVNNHFELTAEASNLLDANTIRFADIRERVLLNEFTGRRIFIGVRGTY
ncbi:TonB-dependent receptor [Marinicaulis flavus]|uniref:TonB-dependent receptor n=1 Tax=Hyphococcus luteus TaxID=2058213 RepID=A0A2S7K2C8_9PROT|nr:TonB-dependent receptor [Marinicaulis flavus]